MALQRTNLLLLVHMTHLSPESLIHQPSVIARCYGRHIKIRRHAGRRFAFSQAIPPLLAWIFMAIPATHITPPLPDVVFGGALGCHLEVVIHVLLVYVSLSIVHDPKMPLADAIGAV